MTVRRPEQTVRGWIALGLVYLCWGSTYLAIRVGVLNFPPLLLAALRFLIPGAVLYAITWRPGGLRVGLKEWRSAAVVGLLLMVGGNGGVTLGEQTLPSGVASLLIATVPFWMVLLDAIQERKLVNRLVLAGLVVGFVGTALLLSPSASQRVDFRGAAFVLAAGLLWAAGSIYSRTAPQAQPPLRAVAMNMLAGGIALAVMGAATGELPLARWSVPAVLAILWLATVGSLIGFSLYFYALRVLPASTVSTYALVNPIVAVLLGWAILHEQVTGQMLVAMLVTLVGVGLIVLARARWALPKPQR